MQKIIKIIGKGPIIYYNIYILKGPPLMILFNKGHFSARYLTFFHSSFLRLLRF
jgi:hypothetical protein